MTAHTDHDPETDINPPLDPETNLIPWPLLLERTLDLLYELEGDLQNAALLRGDNPIWTRVAYHVCPGMEADANTLARLPECALAIAPFLPRIARVKDAIFNLL